ncbi:MAG: transketolase [Actinomycetota bacterium]|nr:transketolase [Actinomycetota bacterium]
MDAVQSAKSGHSGTAMALAPLAHVLFHRVMRHDPADPDWPDRDRFVLSAGHASILLYSMLHLSGYDLGLDDIKAFRQFESRTPGHPERNHTPGVEVTTGPLGQGFGNGVGMGIAERFLRARFGPELCDHHTFVVASDGDLSEGISHEAASLAGHLGLGRLVYVYDDNHITIDGPTELALSDRAGERFRSYGWDVDDIGEVANDCSALESTLRRAMAVEDKPSLIILRSHIGWPSPTRTDTPAAHGEPFGDEEIAATKERLGLPVDERYHVPTEVLDHYGSVRERGRVLSAGWGSRLESSSVDRAAYDACLAGRGLEGWEAKLPTWAAGEKVATRKASAAVIAAIQDVVPGLVGGGADLTGNTGTTIKGEGVQSSAEPGGRQLYFGVREHGMGAAMNGMAMHGGTIPIGGTFLVFSDYMRPSVRLASISGAHVIYSWTHDSVGLGEDGPTHQPIEHLASLRAIPGVRVVRPADANETATAWRVAVDVDGPVALILSRQDLPVLEGTEGSDGLLRGAYTLVDGGGADPDLILIGTGSEVHVCAEAAALLEADGITTRVVSMPSWELFAEQSDEYQDEVLVPEAPTLAVEAGSSLGWERWADDVVALDRFGVSAPGAEALAKLGYNPEDVADRARALLADLMED